MTEFLNPICPKCKHFRPMAGGCEAFPEGIPDEILETNQHSEELEGQVPGITFEELPEDERPPDAPPQV